MPDTLSSSFTVRPWIKTGGVPLSAQMTHATTKGIDSPTHSTPTHSKSPSPSLETTIPPPTRNSITTTSTTITPHTSTHPRNSPSSTPTPRHTPTPMPSQPRHSLHTPESRWIPRSSLSLRSRDRDRHIDRVTPTPQHTPPLFRSRGKTVPPPSLDPQARFQTPDKRSGRRSGAGNAGADADAEDAQSVLSYTPSMSGKQFAGWLSGLLGGR
ncbi:hypothetical protein IAQ61_000177 [Plenodomus lingam]|uniref:uncharacterized protein n=1 Tax=Leptosphaeria maculans TaxID=5022 RepID=UPI0033264671|nr:hypothetical protein IAQ61_000177 [Plenodomus lingam]